MIGSSPAGVRFIEELSKSEMSCEFSILSCDGQYPCDRNVFPQLISQDISQEEALYKSMEFYKDRNINVCLDKKITRINFKRQKIFTEEKEQLDFDILVLTGTPGYKFSDIKGTNKIGVYGFKKISDIYQAIKNLPIMETVVIQSDSFFGLKMACALAKKKKDVLLIQSGNSVISDYLSCEVNERLVRLLGKQGVRIVRNSVVSEVLGDGDVKAVKLNSGKVVACQAVFFGDTQEDLKFVLGQDLKIIKKVFVNEHFNTNIDSVIALDSICELENGYDREDCLPLDILEEQGAWAASQLIGNQKEITAPKISNSIHLEGLTLTVMGQVLCAGKISLKQTLDNSSEKYETLILRGDQPVGAICINCEERKESLSNEIYKNNEPAKNISLDSHQEGAQENLLEKSH